LGEVLKKRRGLSRKKKKTVGPHVLVVKRTGGPHEKRKNRAGGGKKSPKPETEGCCSVIGEKGLTGIRPSQTPSINVRQPSVERGRRPLETE